ncbi:unnamed protein product [Parnassius apollo]|uniref:(apollo) hypothetical protein n=1 Tax=Parnassius apollo TaxID=110799 RepID=A0A8S3X5C4_PARAO|nr:unnamed protein product [Parnassius apollo]
MPKLLLKPFKGMMNVHQIVWDKNNKDLIALRRQSCITDLCKNYAIACPHDKHLGFYSHPTEESNQTNSSKELVIISNVVLVPSREERSRNNFQNQFEEHLLQNQKSDDEYEGERASCPSLEVAKIQRSEAFLARTNAELPRELQDIKTAKFEEQTFCLSQDVSMIIETSAVTDINSDLDITLEPSEIVMFETSTPFEAAPIYAETLIALPGASTADNEAISDPMNVSCVNPLGSEFDEASSNITGLEKAKLKDPYENIQIGSWVVTSYQCQLKKNTAIKYFIGQVININHDDNTFTVKYLRRIKNTVNVFSWPNKDDEDCVTKNVIVKVLQEPNINRRGQLIFDDIENLLPE